MPEPIPSRITDPARTADGAAPPGPDTWAATDYRSGGGGADLGSVGVEHYVVGEEIASGRMGKVYRATDTLGREVAVMVSQQDLAAGSGVAGQFPRRLTCHWKVSCRPSASCRARPLMFRLR
jgi:hypothetical protein